MTAREPVNSSHRKIVWRVDRRVSQRCDELAVAFRRRKGTKKSHKIDFWFIRNGVWRKIENTGFNYTCLPECLPDEATPVTGWFDLRSLLDYGPKTNSSQLKWILWQSIFEPKEL